MKQQQLTFDKGITNVPSDVVCSDNTLAESVGMIYDEGEHRVIQRPSEFMTGLSGSQRLLYVHKFNDQERFIYTTGTSVGWGTRGSDGAFTDKGTLVSHAGASSVNVTSIGKTLVLNFGNDITYFLWKNDVTYYNLGKLPEPDIDFKMYKNLPANGIGIGEGNSANSQSCEFMIVNKYAGIYPEPGKEEDYSNMVVGLYEKNLKDVKKKKRFAEPFAVRCALELFDGSYAMQSVPVMLFPAIRQNTAAFYSDLNKKVSVFTERAALLFRASFDYSAWSDIVKDVVVFATEGVRLYDTSDDQKSVLIETSNEYHEGIIALSKNGPSEYYTKSTNKSSQEYDHYFFPLNRRDEKEIFEDVKSLSVFYKIFSIGTRSKGDWEEAAEYIRDKTLENLTTQEQLNDDYYSHTTLSSSNMVSYNNRLLLSNVRRSFYDGYSSFLPYDNSQSYTYHIYVHIDTTDGERIVRKVLSTTQKIGNYFFYPDPRAKKADFFFYDGRHVKTIELKEHPYLNGAYFFDHLPEGTEGEPSASGGTKEPTENAAEEILGNQIWVSEVNNPFVFRAEGNVSVGNGRIIGMSSITQALSQGQFGQYPLIVFTDEGIWAVSVGTTGLLQAVHPMSREVCNNPQSITQTDGAVFFASAKGLMAISGSIVKCVSEQMAGTTDKFSSEIIKGSHLGNFSEFIAKCFIAYDYRDSLLWLFNDGAPACYVYAIKSGTFAKCVPPGAIRNVVNYYPDYLVQDIYGNAYSLMQRTDINADTSDYNAQMLTRPMKLENGLALKTISQILHIRQMQGNLVLRIYVSNTLESWAEIHSIHGTPWKYYRFKYEFSSLKATDRFAGSVVTTEEIRTNKLR